MSQGGLAGGLGEDETSQWLFVQRVPERMGGRNMSPAHPRWKQGSDASSRIKMELGGGRWAGGGAQCGRSSSSLSKWASASHGGVFVVPC